MFKVLTVNIRWYLTDYKKLHQIMFLAIHEDVEHTI